MLRYDVTQSNSRKQGVRRTRKCRIDALEDRCLLATDLLLVGDQQLSVSTNVNVSSEPGANQHEVMIAVDPSNPLNIAAFSHRHERTTAEIQQRNSINLFLSSDGGTSWSQKIIDDGTLGSGGSGFDDGLPSGDRFDPSVVFDESGRLFFLYGHRDFANSTEHLVVGWTDDMGLSTQFNTSVAVNDANATPGQFLDKWHIAVGPDASSPSGSAVYVAYMLLSSEDKVFVTGSRDSGLSFLPAIRVDDGVDDSQLFPHPAVGPNGELYVSWWGLERGVEHRIYVDRDLDGLWGNTESFGDDLLVATTLQSTFAPQPPAQPNRGVRVGPVIDVRQSDGRVFLAWNDTAPGYNYLDSGQQTNADMDIFLAYSDELQQASITTPSWTLSGQDGRVDDATSTDFLPWVDVDQTTGSVSVLYYQSTELDGGSLDSVNVVARVSTDGGASFGPRAIVSDVSSSAADIQSPIISRGDFLEYIGLAVHDGVLHAIWADNRDNPTLDWELYYARASFTGAADNTLRVRDGGVSTPAIETVTIAPNPTDSEYVDVFLNDQLAYRGLSASFDTIEIEAATPASVRVTGGEGGYDVAVKGAAEPRLRDFLFSGGAGDDTLVFDRTTGDPWPQAGFAFAFEGNAGADSVQVRELGGSGQVVTRPAYFVEAEINPDFTVGATLPDSQTPTGDRHTLRSAIAAANAAGEPAYVFLPSSTIGLTLEGTDDTVANDLDVTGDLTIVGAGAGVSVIDGYGLSYAGPADTKQTFHVSGAGARLDISRTTLRGTDVSPSSAAIGGGAILADNSATLRVAESAIVAAADSTGTRGVGIASVSSDTVIERSVFVPTDGQTGVAVYVEGPVGSPGSLTIHDSVFAGNGSGGSTPYVTVSGGNVQLATNGANLHDNASGGFFDTVSGASQPLASPTQVVTSSADTWTATPDSEQLSLRDAVFAANSDPKVLDEVWLPAWDFTLTRRLDDADLYDTAFNDLDVLGELVIRGVAGKTSIGWLPTVVDDVFQQIGDFEPDGDVDITDFGLFADAFGSVLGDANYDARADYDSDNDVDITDFGIFADAFGTVFLLLL